jgi:hypothetical protein
MLSGIRCRSYRQTTILMVFTEDENHEVLKKYRKGVYFVVLIVKHNYLSLFVERNTYYSVIRPTHNKLVVFDDQYNEVHTFPVLVTQWG